MVRSTRMRNLLLFLSLTIYTGLLDAQMLMMGEASEQWKARPCGLYVYVEDVDSVYQKAVQAQRR